MFHIVTVLMIGGGIIDVYRQSRHEGSSKAALRKSCLNEKISDLILLRFLSQQTTQHVRIYTSHHKRAAHLS